MGKNKYLQDVTTPVYFPSIIKESTSSLIWGLILTQFWAIILLCMQGKMSGFLFFTKHPLLKFMKAIFHWGNILKSLWVKHQITSSYANANYLSKINR